MSKVTLITGASSGIGLALCEELFAENSDHYVYGLDRKPQEFFLGNPKYTHLCCDLLEFESVQTIIEDSGINKMKINTLVNCAGIMPTSPVFKLDPKLASEAFSLNCIAPLYLVKLLLKSLTRAENPLVINVTSIAAELNIPGEIIYGATKAALKHASESMSIELARFGIGVNCVAPALVMTTMTEHLTESQIDYMHAKQAYKSEVTSKDVAIAINYLMDGPGFISGSTLYVGGISR